MSDDFVDRVMDCCLIALVVSFAAMVAAGATLIVLFTIRAVLS